MFFKVSLLFLYFMALSSLRAEAFPPGFQFGVATAGFQNEMGCADGTLPFCTDPNSDWYQWITSPVTAQNRKLYMSGHPPAYAPGMYQFYKEDIALARHDLGVNAFRLSFEWSRIFPRSTVAASSMEELRALASPDALAYYHSLLRELAEQDIKPMVTVNHYTLPLWIHDGVACYQNLAKCPRRDWLDRERTVREIAKFAGFVAAEFGGEVDLWATLNEPLSAIMLAGYLQPRAERVNPPGLGLRIAEAKEVTLALIEGHARMYDAIRAADHYDADGDGMNASIGLVYGMTQIEPASARREDQEAAAHADYLFHKMFLRAVAFGQVDANWDGRIVQRPDLMNRLDFIGINYYYKMLIKDGGWFNPLKIISPFGTFSLDDLQLISDYPEGLYQVIKDAEAYGRPIYITETGREVQVSERAATAWLQGTLAATERALAEGAAVRGYYYWTLTDNYEWNHGFEMKFGLYAVDPLDPGKRRRLRPAGLAYRDFLQQLKGK